MSRSSLLACATLAILPLTGCNLQNSENKQVVREGKERDTAIEAAKNHPAASGNPDATGKPLPPLPGVDVPAPQTEGANESAMGSGNEDHSTEHDHH